MTRREFNILFRAWLAFFLFNSAMIYVWIFARMDESVRQRLGMVLFFGAFAKVVGAFVLGMIYDFNHRDWAEEGRKP